MNDYGTGPDRNLCRPVEQRGAPMQPLSVGQSSKILDLIQGWTSWMESRSDSATGEASSATTTVHIVQDHMARLAPSPGLSLAGPTHLLGPVLVP